MYVIYGMLQRKRTGKKDFVTLNAPKNKCIYKPAIAKTALGCSSNRYA